MHFLGHDAFLALVGGSQLVGMLGIPGQTDPGGVSPVGVGGGTDRP
jgi:hypothetical protein